MCVLGVVSGQCWGVWGNHELSFRCINNEMSVRYSSGCAGRKLNVWVRNPRGPKIPAKIIVYISSQRQIVVAF